MTLRTYLGITGAIIIQCIGTQFIASGPSSFWAIMGYAVFQVVGIRIVYELAKRERDDTD